MKILQLQYFTRRRVQSFTKIKWDKVNFDCVIRYFCEIHLLGNKSVKNKKTILINVIIRQYFKNSESFN
jgi:hypothetical protein